MLFRKENVDFLNDKIKSMYLKYLAVHFFSLIESVVDMAIVGQYQGLDGAAFLALVSPIWNIIYSLGLLIGSRYYQISLKKEDTISRSCLLFAINSLVFRYKELLRNCLLLLDILRKICKVFV